MRLARGSAGLVISLGLVVACSTSSAEPTAPPDASVADGSIDAPADAGAETSSGSRYRAFFMIERWLRTDPLAKNTMTAAPIFRSDGLPRYTQIDEHCGYHEGDWKSAGLRPPSFGAITMHAPSTGWVTWVEDAEGAAWDAPPGTLAWNAGDAITVKASGRDLPGFELQDVVPEPALLTNHDMPSLRAGALRIPRAAPFALAWTPVPTEVFALFLQFRDYPDKSVGILCFFPGDRGAAEIPRAVLEHLEPAQSVLFTNFYFSAASRKRVALERVDVEMITWNGHSARVTID